MKIMTHFFLTILSGGLWPIYLLLKPFLGRNRFKRKAITMNQIDNMDGEDFELFLEALFSTLNFVVHRTQLTGDYGADLIIEKSNTRIAVQAKRYSSNVGVSAVQEVVASKEFYSCDEAMVVTNNYFTHAAQKLAHANNVLLLDRDWLIGELFS